MISDDLEDFKDEIDNVERLLTNLVVEHSPAICFQAMVRTIAMMMIVDQPLSCQESNFQCYYKDICDLCTSFKEQQ